MLCEANAIDTVVLSGGVFQNESPARPRHRSAPSHIWTSGPTPPLQPTTEASAWAKPRWRCFEQSSAPMHELSIAMSILEMAEEESEKHGGDNRGSHLRAYSEPLSGVVSAGADYPPTNWRVSRRHSKTAGSLLKHSHRHLLREMSGRALCRVPAVVLLRASAARRPLKCYAAASYRFPR